ncbi:MULTISPECIES: hypothetical protein [unclassified Aurantimonas]|uniref:hypothetical protein n=1 Tax=unclassified Aurantimonas TaxID=2638230 RepID=UPI002E19FE9C|nr:MULTISPECIES: hypothetical protein [unclassified Aurantimonas]MEC5289382.1 hypothetical protein [Aurantimonas sp. C2-3-R2]MEC5410462.1 hypothetical protein [Aurantimonas sp. C2-4-R8]
MKNTLLLIAIMAWPVSASAEEAKPMSGLDFMIEAPNLVDQRVRIEGHRVDGLSFQGGYYRLEGGSALLRPPWRDREDFRALIPTCENQWFDSPEQEARCIVTIEATVAEENSGYPVLQDVDFILE